jgi:membrane protein
MIITLGPILIGASVVVSTYLLGFAAVAEEYTAGLGTFLLKWVPSLLALIAFLIIFMLVPNTRVKFKHALAGAILSTFLFELSKKGFALYVKNFPSYELIYGALAVIPILFVWVYLSWIVVLIGAEFTCSVKEAKFLDLDENKEKNT